MRILLKYFKMHEFLLWVSSLCLLLYCFGRQNESTRFNTYPDALLMTAVYLRFLHMLQEQYPPHFARTFYEVMIHRGCEGG